MPLEIPMSESNCMVERDKCGLNLLCKKEKRHSIMSGGVRLGSQALSDAKDAIQYIRSSLDMFPSGPMVSVQYPAMSMHNFQFWCSWNKRWCCHYINQDVFEVPSSVVWHQ